MKVLILSFALILSISAISASNQFKLFDYKASENNVTLSRGVDEFPAYFDLLYAIQYILLGKPTPGKPGIFELLDIVPNDTNLVDMIGFASQQFYVFWTENDYDEEGFQELFDQWKDTIFYPLYYDGAEAVTFGNLRPFIEFLRPGNLVRVLLKLQKSKDNFNQYLQEEFLSKIKDPYCRNYVGLWFRDIQQGKGWALSMFDNIGKPPTGILNGNINWVGSHKACKKVEVYLNKNAGFHGKYCRTTIGFPLDALPDVGIPLNDNLGLNIGWCVPNVCNKEDVTAISAQVLRLLAVHKFLFVKNVVCDEPIPYSKEFIGFTVFLSIIGFIVVFATVFDGIRRVAKSKDENKFPVNTPEDIEKKIKITGSGVVDTKQIKPVKEKKHPFVDFLLNCSLYLNSERIFRTDNGGKFTCLNGIRALSMVWIIFSHTFNYLGDYKLFFLLSNIYELKEIEEQPVAQLIINGMYGVDTFFVMSAFLLTYSMMNKFEKSNGLTPFEWFYYYVHRYWRLLPPYLIIMVIYIWIMPFVGNGPLWDPNNFPSSRKDCENYWWAYILLINNFVPNGKGTTCMGYLWYVPNDYQLYAISPLFLILLFKYPVAGMVLLGFTLISSVSILAFLTENVYAKNNKVILSTLQSIWEDVYIKPYCRAGPWIVGIFLGYFFFKHKKVTVNKLLLLAGWVTSIVFALTAVFGGYTNHEVGGRRMTIPEYGSYFSLTRVTFPLSIAWVIFACHYGYGGVINRFLSSNAFIPLTRISYCAYLIHPVIMNAYFYSQDALFHGNGMTLVYLLIGNTIFTFFVAYLYTMFFEQPFVALEKLLMSGRKSKGGDE